MLAEWYASFFIGSWHGIIDTIDTFTRACLSCRVKLRPAPERVRIWVEGEFMFLQLLRAWPSRLVCGLLIATIIAPEVRCCCNISWGPAGLCQPVSAHQRPATKPKCCCCPAPGLQEGQLVDGFPGCEQCACRCIFQTASIAPASSTIVQEPPLSVLVQTKVSVPTEVRGCILVDFGVEPHPPSLTVLQCCARFQSWQI